MSVQWMKHVLIASILTVLMTLPATAQQRRLSGPAKPAAGTPGKLEVPKELVGVVRDVIQARKTILRAEVNLMEKLRKVKVEADNFKSKGGDLRVDMNGVKNDLIAVVIITALGAGAENTTDVLSKSIGTRTARQGIFPRRSTASFSAEVDSYSQSSVANFSAEVDSYINTLKRELTSLPAVVYFP